VLIKSALECWLDSGPISAFFAEPCGVPWGSWTAGVHKGTLNDRETMMEGTMKHRNVKAPSLRYLLGWSSGIVVFLLAGFDGGVSGPASAFGAEASARGSSKTAAVPQDSVEPVYRVVSPLGDSAVKMITMAPRLDTLEGKTVCMVWNHAFKADITLPAIAESLKSKYPDIKIVPYTEIDAAIRAAGHEDTSTDAATLRAVLKEQDCDAVISGNGG
jgi:hypothetical protein